jgi:hypothetical protein
MRTVIYAHAPSTIAIQAKDPRDAAVLLYRYNRAGHRVPPGEHQLERGIYLIYSHGELAVSGGDTTVIALTGDKDLPPEPRAQVIALEPGADAPSIKRFLELAKGITVGDPPQAPVSPTSKITDDPDGI